MDKNKVYKMRNFDINKTIKKMKKEKYIKSKAKKLPKIDNYKSKVDIN